jgi:putative flippase GtrA
VTGGPRRALAAQALRFIVVGVANTLVTFAVIWALREGFAAPVWLASATGYGVGMLQGFILNRGWTFAATARAGRADRQALGFVAVNIACGLFFTLANVVLHRWLPLQVSSVLAAAAAMPLSFALNRWFVFGRAAPRR